MLCDALPHNMTARSKQIPIRQNIPRPNNDEGNFWKMCAPAATLLFLALFATSTMAQTFDAVVVRTLNNTRYADQYSSVQAAIDDTPEGGTLKIPVGSYPLSGGGAQLLLIQKSITIEGDGWGSVLQVPSSASNFTDVIRVNKNSGQTVGLVFRNFAILPASGTPARYGINFDAQNGTSIIADFQLDHVLIGQLGGAAVAAFGPGPPVFDGVFTSAITNSQLTGGIELQQAGDSLSIYHNTIPGKGTVTINLVGAGTNTAHGFLFMGNNVTCSGGIHLVNAWNGVIAYNNIELYPGATGSNGAVLDLDGNAAIPPENFEVIGNFLAGAGLTGIRVNQVVGTFIGQNMLPRGSGPTIQITPLADRTQIIMNRTQPAGELISTWLDDRGGNTIVDYIHPNTGRRTITSQTDFQRGISINDGPALQTSTQTGTGDLVLSNSPQLSNPGIGDATGTSLTLNGGAPLTSTAQTGSGSIVMSTFPTINKPFINGTITLNQQLIESRATPGVAVPLPQTPSGYLLLNLGDRVIKVPFYNY